MTNLSFNQLNKEIIGEVGYVALEQPDSNAWHTVQLQQTYKNPVVVMGPASFNGPDPLTIRVKEVTGNSFQFQIDEWKYLDGYHARETIGYLVLEKGTYTLDSGVKVTAGSTPVNHNWSTVNFDEVFSDPPVVISQCASYAGSDPVVTRQQAVTASSFQVRLQEEEAGDGTHAMETVMWVAVQQGSGLSQGLSFKAEVTPRQIDHTWSKISWPALDEADSVFLAAMQTFWGADTATLRYKDLSASKVSVFVEEETSKNPETGHTTEAVGYIAFSRPGLLYKGNREKITSRSSLTEDVILNPTGNGWQKVPGSLKHISVGSDGTVWGVNSNDDIYYRKDNAWQKVSGSLKQISVGNATTVWGVNRNDDIYYRKDNQWQKVDGKLKHVSVGSDGTVWGVNRNDDIYYRKDNAWQKVSGSLKQISVGNATTVWGVNRNDDIYYRKDNQWQKVDGKLKYVSVASDGTVWGVNSNDNIYYRQGDGWKQVSGSLKQISVGSDGTVWGVNRNDNIYDLQRKYINKPVYRTSISVTPLTSWVDVWASEEVTVEINDQSYTLDPVKPVRVKPNHLAKLSVSIPATDVSCPNLILRTNMMLPAQRHYIFPDVEAHKKIVGLQEGDLFKARDQLGIPSNYTEEDIGHFQKALQNMAKTVQHTYNKTPHGVHHDRALHPVNMEDPHFSLDFGDQLRYQARDATEIPGLTAGATLLQGDVAQGLFDDLGKAISQASQVIVHTVENVGQDIVQTATNVGKDVVQTVDQVGEDIVHGDIPHAGEDLLQGGENVGRDLVKGTGQVAGDVVEGAGQLIVITAKTATGMVQFVVTETKHIGRVLGEMFKKIGADINKAVNWLLDKLNWSDILYTHNVLKDLLNSKIDEVPDYLNGFKQRMDQFLANLTNFIDQELDQVIAQLDAPSLAKQPQPVQSHSGAVEKIDWLLGKIPSDSSGADALALPMPAGFDGSPINNLITQIEQQLGQDGDKILDALENAGVDIAEIFTNPEHAPQYLLEAVLEIVKALAILSLDVLQSVLDAVLDLLAGFLQEFKTRVNAPLQIPFITDLYKTITNGSEMSLLDFGCLLIAIPATIISKVEFNALPFGSQRVGASLAEQSANVKGWAVVYSACHIILGVTGGFAAAEAASEAEEAATPTADRPGRIVAAIDVIAGFTAQIAGNPCTPGQQYVLPPSTTLYDVFEAPNRKAHDIWLFQWVGWGLNLLLSPNLPALINTAWGVLHCMFMSLLFSYDHRKSKVLKLLDNPVYNAKSSLELFQALDNHAKEVWPAHQSYWEPFENKLVHRDSVGAVKDEKPIKDWVDEARNYYQWSKSGGPGLKLLGNIMDTLPEMAQLGTLPAIVKSYPFCLVGTIFIVTIGNYVEAAIYFSRAKSNGLL